MDPRDPTSARLPLAGLRVLDGAGRTAPHCGLFLSLFGADVIVVDHESTATTAAELDWISFNLGKRRLHLDPREPDAQQRFRALAAEADVVIEGDRPIVGFDLSSTNTRGIHVTISQFGLRGPRATWRSTELIAQAAGGILYLSGDAAFPPALIGMPLARSMAGAHAACAVMLALAQRRQTEKGARIDVSQQEAVANLLFTTQFMAHVGEEAGRRGEAALTVSDDKLTRRVLWPCKDGYVTWTIWTGPGMGPKNLQTFQWMHERGVPEAEELLQVPWARMSTEDLTRDLLDTVNRSVGAFFSTYTKRQITDEAVARRLFLYAVGSPADIMTNEQLRARDAFRELEMPDGRTVEIVATPLRSTAYRIELPGHSPISATSDILDEQTSWTPEPVRTAPTTRPASSVAGLAPAALPLAGLRVLDLSWAVVSPLMTKYLAMFGADVVKFEYRKRPDPTRMTGPYPRGKPSIDGSAPFVSINTSKRSVGIDLQKPESRDLINRLVARSDVVCENFAPGVATRLGYGYDDLRAYKPDLIMLSLSMQGQSGPHSGRPGLGNHLQAMAGIDHHTGFPDGPPGGPNQVMPDFVGPWLPFVALLAALEHHRMTGEGQYVDCAQLEAMFLFMQPSLLQFQTSGVVPQRRGNSSPHMAPHGVYPTIGDDRWIAIAVESDDAWRSLWSMLPDAARSQFPQHMTAPERVAATGPLDSAMAEWTAGFVAEALAERLQTIGVAAYTVSDAYQLLADPQLAFRSHYRHVDHPKLGDQIVDAPAFRFDDLEPRIVAGPAYADDTVSVLDEWIQLDGDELAELIAGGALDF